MKFFKRILLICVIIYILGDMEFGSVSDWPTQTTSIPSGSALSATILPEHTYQPAIAAPEDTPQPTIMPTITPAPTVAQTNAISPYRLSYPSPYNADGSLSDEGLTWGFNRKENHQPPDAPFKYDIRPFGGYYLGDISKSVVYLTFDEGYEYGFTPTILDTLKEKGVKAAFFVTKSFVNQCPELCIRMKEEGHIVGNHTVNHRKSSILTDAEFTYEITELERYFKEVTGYDLDKYFRFPEGEYSMKVLNSTYKLGYKSVFWSLAYKDWEVDNQPGRQAAFEHVTNYFHNGCIILLHAVSESNTQALGDIIDFIRAQGFEFSTLNLLDGD